MEHDAELQLLEEAMWRPETRGDKQWMDAHLADGFVEFGQSGRRYSRADIIDVAIGDFSAVLPLPHLSMRPLGEDHVLVTYQSEIDGSRANRSSIWQRTPSGWLMEFHQGTPIAEPSSTKKRQGHRRSPTHHVRQADGPEGPSPTQSINTHSMVSGT